MISKSKKEDNFLLYVPRHKHSVWEEKNGRVYLIFHHKKLIEKLVIWLYKKPDVSDIELDEMGSAAWKLIDGKKTVFEISELLREKFGNSQEDSQERLIMFVRYLLRRGWVSLDRGNQKKL